MRKKLVILGGGESGTGTAVLAKKQGYDVFLSDSGALKQKYIDILDDYEIEWEDGMHSIEKMADCIEVVKSPGIPDKAEIVKMFKSLNIPVISEIEFASRYTSAKMICITGSNGKTTTTLLTYHLLKKAGLNVGLAGNVGESFAMQVARNNFDYYVLELSSFQLDGMFRFRANIAILLNITPDHLDRYDYKFENYIDSKFRILQNQAPEDAFIFCDDDEVILDKMKSIQILAQKYPFSALHPVTKGAFIQNDQINITQNNFTMSLIELALQGRHNAYNSMASAIAASVLQIRKQTIRECLSDFQGVEHRLEPVVRVHGIQFINDSKATNINSTWYALETIQSPIIWIVGGVDKGNDYSTLTELVKKKVKSIICLGTDNSKIIESFSGIVDKIVETRSMSEAVQKAYYMGTKGDHVLLSPACASFDLFENYEDRGQQFKKAVRNL